MRQSCLSAMAVPYQPNRRHVLLPDRCVAARARTRECSFFPSRTAMDVRLIKFLVHAAFYMFEITTMDKSLACFCC